MLFYSGDKVRILKSSNDDIPEIAEMIGGVYVIEEVCAFEEFCESTFMINGWFFTPDEIQLVEEE